MQEAAEAISVDVPNTLNNGNLSEPDSERPKRHYGDSNNELEVLEHGGSIISELLKPAFITASHNHVIKNKLAGHDEPRSTPYGESTGNKVITLRKGFSFGSKGSSSNNEIHSRPGLIIAPENRQHTKNPPLWSILPILPVAIKNHGAKTHQSHEFTLHEPLRTKQPSLEPKALITAPLHHPTTTFRPSSAIYREHLFVPSSTPTSLVSTNGVHLQKKDFAGSKIINRPLISGNHDGKFIDEAWMASLVPNDGISKNIPSLTDHPNLPRLHFPIIPVAIASTPGPHLHPPLIAKPNRPEIDLIHHHQVHQNHDHHQQNHGKYHGNNRFEALNEDGARSFAGIFANELRAKGFYFLPEVIENRLPYLLRGYVPPGNELWMFLPNQEEMERRFLKHRRSPEDQDALLKKIIAVATEETARNGGILDHPYETKMITLDSSVIFYQNLTAENPDWTFHKIMAANGMQIVERSEIRGYGAIQFTNGVMNLRNLTISEFLAYEAVHHPYLNDFILALQETGYWPQLHHDEEAMTLLVPSPEAWKNAALMVKDFREKHDMETLKRVFGRHMIRGAQFTIGMPRFQKLTDYAGDTLRIFSSLQSKGMVKINQAKMLSDYDHRDLAMTNGVVHFIDSVLISPEDIDKQLSAYLPLEHRSYEDIPIRHHRAAAAESTMDEIQKSDSEIYNGKDGQQEEADEGSDDGGQAVGSGNGAGKVEEKKKLVFRDPISISG